MKFFSTGVLAATALMRANGGPALRSVSPKESRSLQASGDECGFLVSNIRQEDPWCITATEGVEEFSSLGFRPCDFVESRSDQLWCFDSNGKIHSKLSLDSCMIIADGRGALFDGVRVRIASCEVDTQMNKFIHDLSTDELRLQMDESYCITNRGQNPNPGDTIHAKPCDNQGRFLFTYRVLEGTPPPGDPNRIPLCIKDERGFRVEPSDPRYDNPKNTLVLSEVTYEDLGVTVQSIQSAIEGFSQAAGFIAGLATAGIAAIVITAIGDFASALVGIFLPLFGFEDNALLSLVKQQAELLNRNIQRVGINMRRDFLQVRELVSNVELDQLVGRIDSLNRAFDDFFKTDDEFRFSIYGPHLRRVCNAPNRRPDDTFFELYGYACDNCTYGSNRADIFGTFREKAKFSSTFFMQNFGNFMTASMLQAMTFYTICPPAEETCTDRSQDETWLKRLETMELAMNETLDLLQRTRMDLDDNWAAGLTPEDFTDAIDASPENNTAIAELILADLMLRQPNYYFQVFVSDNFSLLRRTTCETDECLPGGKVASFRNFDNVFGKDIHIRFRHEDLGLRDTTFSAGNISKPFESYYQEKYNGRLGAKDYQPLELDGSCPPTFTPCLFGTCPPVFSPCPLNVQEEWERITGRDKEGFVAGWDYDKIIRDLGVAAMPPEAFPSVILTMVHRIDRQTFFGEVEEENRYFYEDINWTVWY